jgi:hypothetical protein
MRPYGTSLFLISLCAFPLFLITPATADEKSQIETELESTLQAIVTRCKTASDPDSCILEKIEKKRRLYEVFLDETAPAAWPDLDIISFIFFHIAQQIGTEQIRCNSLEASAKQLCADQLPALVTDAREDARHLLIAKGAAYGKREAAERHAQDRRRQQESANAQREHEMDLARIRALGMFLGNGGFMRPVPSQPAYQPPPPVSVPPLMYQPAPRPPVSCSSRMAGQTVYTDCY